MWATNCPYGPLASGYGARDILVESNWRQWVVSEPIEPEFYRLHPYEGCNIDRLRRFDSPQESEAWYWRKYPLSHAALGKPHHAGDYGVRVERLNEISEADAKAEGVERDSFGHWFDYSLSRAGVVNL